MSQITPVYLKVFEKSILSSQPFAIILLTNPKLIVILYLPILAAFEFLQHQAEDQALPQADQDSFLGYQERSCSDMPEQSIVNEENFP